MQPHCFICSLSSTLAALFWALFGHGDVNEAEMNLKDPAGGVVSHHMTEIVGYISIGAYHVVAIIILLNMLIAMMSHSFENIQVNDITGDAFGSLL